MSDIVAKADPKEVMKTYSLPAEWKIDEAGATALMTASVMSQNQYSRYAAVPIVCKGKECPFITTCGMDAVGIDVEKLVGQRCPIEVQFIMDKFNSYIEELDIDKDAEIDLSLVKELVDLDVMLLRADNKMAKEVDFIENVAASINVQGQVIYRKEVSKTVEFKERTMKKRHEILRLLNSTRKDKAGDKLTVSMDPSTYAIELLQKKEEQERLEEEKRQAIEAEYETLGD